MQEPLAYRMRPKTLAEVVGQEHLIGEGKLLNRMLKAGRLSSLILYGPPGTGKTTIAKVIANEMNLPFHYLNAVSSGKKEMEQVVAEAKFMGQTILFVDEVHRFHKGQQDYLLPFIESGLIVFIGATTENPYIEINKAILSRCTVLELKALKQEDILLVLKRALSDKEKGLGAYPVEIGDETLVFVAERSNGDIRTALNALEIAVLSTEKTDGGKIVVDIQTMQDCLQNKTIRYDKKGEEYYNVISAFQKSIRGSDVHASLHYLARLIEAGDLSIICRRLLVTAWEDIGLANPAACANVLAAVESAERLGLPEGRIPLAVAVVELCLSPKSNSAYKALDRALADVRTKNVGDVPDHLKDAHYEGAKKLGRGTNYLYPHDYGGWVYQQYLPDALNGKKYYEPKHVGNEKHLAQLYEKIEELTKKKR